MLSRKSPMVGAESGRQIMATLSKGCELFRSMRIRLSVSFIAYPAMPGAKSFCALRTTLRMASLLQLNTASRDPLVRISEYGNTDRVRIAKFSCKRRRTSAVSVFP